MKIEFIFAGILLAALVGFLIGSLVEHPPGPGGYQFIGALIGVMVALTVLTLGESLKSQTAT